MGQMIKLKESVNNFVSYMRETQSKEKADIAENLKKMTEMQELQLSSNYLTNACEVYESRILEARSPKLLPKTVVEIVQDTRLGESCDFENFVNKESVDNLNNRIRKDRVFLMQNRKLGKVAPKKAGLFP